MPVSYESPTREDIYQCLSRRVSVWFISRLGPNCQSCVQSSTSLPQNANDFVGVKKKKTSSAGLGPNSGADICEALLSVGVVAAFRRWQPCHRRRSALLTLKQNSGSRPDMASRARAQGWSKRHGRYKRDQVQNCGEIPLLNISETLFSAFRQISASIYSPFPSLKWAPLDFLNFINLCRQWTLTRGLHSGRKQRKTTNKERGI